MEIPNNIQEILKNSTTWKEVIIKLGWQHSSFNRNILKLRRYVEDNKIDISHFKYKPKTDLITAEKKLKAQLDRKYLRVKLERNDPKYFAKYIFYNANNYDVKNNLSNDLSLTKIKDLLSKADFKCTYCLNDKLRLTLDRKDNSIWHIVENVVIACIRCNYVRGDMPYEAWLLLVPGIRLALDKNLFGDWKNKGISRK
jgi:hypothetical protein